MKNERITIRLRIEKDVEEFKELKEFYPDEANTEILRRIIKYYKATSPAYIMLKNAQKLQIELDEIEKRTKDRNFE